jgi:hypothetical protein
VNTPILGTLHLLRQRRTTRPSSTELPVNDLAAVAAGLAAALAPTALRNHSLKQYSADAFVTLLLLWLTARLEAGWSRCRLASLCLVCVPAVLVSRATVFVSAAVLGALAVRALVQRSERLGWLLVLGLGVAVVEAAVCLAFAAPVDNALMRRVWADEIIPLGRGVGPAAGVAADRFTDALQRIGFGPWPLCGGGGHDRAGGAVAGGPAGRCGGGRPAGG